MIISFPSKNLKRHVTDGYQELGLVSTPSGMSIRLIDGNLTNAFG